ncbi:leucyl aminopeptidase family protein [Pseudosulfitobacter pseudonitzschiae]|uniref:leucyl aminopeptidase family protein n=1 Tax=Pseudosulfitobacter pseudonitzschiae TaxID=1402135 RepID=UPI001AF288BC|nr:leucyl aminopeptidase family protein [Pseudosulfitobacter pseudonitzschiae]MBM1815777.1 leucyl aminopeptidase family protein [Pseudosulfitobacter pseudonitzschiae]MBM1832768.1 leucyl aminopeptidase family protein [Pseudosulfitobacter pseudonitzschiae]MBM1837636.1 leucyl aminopeptidase family protein [Pseudosulfitobacter pseudonitzschiae]MBM1842482.1 leucyl aminopeptidase family protein [Pseudosulfitobacter pseudonitzschiae]MBM1847350.1 leucyl aminopeptidase family protein [Pseudosulfitobact
MPLTQSTFTRTDTAIPLIVVPEDTCADWLASLDAPAQAWAETTGFAGKIGQALVIPDMDGAVQLAAVGYGSAVDRARGRFHVAAALPKLPAGTYDLRGDLSASALDAEALGWLLASYRFDRYCAQSPARALLIAPEGVDSTRIEAIAAGEALTRDLINTPASDMGPPDLEAAAKQLAEDFGADMTVTVGDDLLTDNFPMIHAVGRAADRAPRLIDMTWGTAGPKLTLVGKGVCFDTGGLNLKPGASMGLMKKDMGGAAAVLGLARMIMALKLPVQLRVLIPAVENSVAGNAFRPQDILTSRKGLTVEINNTDAEGRLVLADALALADEGKPDLIVSMATLTGAARVAVGPDLAPYYVDDLSLVTALEQAAEAVSDPVWRMPFHAPYEAMIEPGIADLDNAPKGGFAGSITAALFLRRFVTDTPRYMHFDIYGWQPSEAPARPKGGVGQGTRALLAALPAVLKL